jgi:solute carrier family 25 carnitine/acylcarnitine transporter 20/29
LGKRFQQEHPEDPLTLSQIFNAGVISGVATTVITAPMELVKLRLQIQGSTGSHIKPKYSGAIDCAVKTYRRQGIRGLYRGTAATLIRDVPG